MKVFLICLFLIAALVAPAFSQERLKQKFEELDTDQDGKLTTAELKGPLFQRLDTNKDGVVLLDEATKALGAAKPESTPDVDAATEKERPLLTKLFQQYDKNSDGKLTRTEVGNPAWFGRSDTDGDNFISLDEALAKLAWVVRGKNAPTGPIEPPKPVAQGPKILKPGEVGVGRQVPDLEFTDLDGKTLQIGALASGGKGVVLAFTSTTCPVSKKFAPELARLEKSLAEEDIAMVFVNPFVSESAEAIRAEIAAHDFQSPYVHDSQEKVSAALGATSTTEVFLLDSTRTLIYRGAIDDRYGIGYQRDEPRERYLAAAVEAMLAGKRPAIGATEAPGCELDLPSPDAEAVVTEVTYHRDVARILQQNCIECHRDGGIAPFALDDFAEVDDRARTIKRVIGDGIMPPWFAHTEPGTESPWTNDRSLSDNDKTDLIAWIDSKDRPMGHSTDGPKPLAFSKEGWQLGEPDLIVSLPNPVPVKADGEMPYINLTAPTGLKEDKWVQAVEILPSQREVVHHALVWAIDPKSSASKFSETRGYFALYVPGTSTRVYPAGYGTKLSAGATLRFQMHYTPNGKATEDQTRVGIYFAKEPPEYQVEITSLSNPRITIPSGASNHPESADKRLSEDITVLGFLPHMHIRGKAFRYQVIGPEGPETLLDVPRYDFNWQLSYRLKEPLHLPAGTHLHVDAWYDNSRENPANPDYTKLVKWGKQTDDEMLIGYIEYFVPVER